MDGHYTKPKTGVGSGVFPLPFDLPLVSVVITNYNYALFLAAAVKSVMEQTYRSIETIIIDDRSTDDSALVLAEIKKTFPQVTTIVNDVNVGQSASMARGLAESKGDYVVFLDADDYLLPTCIETHVQAHLSCRIPVGFTSVDMILVKDNQIITTAAPHFSAFFMAEDRQIAKLYRPLDAAIFSFSPSAINPADLGDALCYVAPTQSNIWPWTPTSGNCFRRDALDLLMKNPNLAALRSCTDCYLLHGVSSLTGSVLIDRPLMAYRLHGKNDFATAANLNQIRSYDLDYLKKRSDQAMIILTDYLLEEAAAFIGKLEMDGYYEKVLCTIENVYPPICETGYSYLTRRLLKMRATLRPILGEAVYDSMIVARCVSPAHQRLMARSAIARRYFETVWLPKVLKDVA